MPARLALPKMTAVLTADLATAAHRTDEPIWPARSKEIGATRLLIRKALLELDHRTRKLRTWHPKNVRMTPDGANRISMSEGISSRTR